jgi:hypothetical protein
VSGLFASILYFLGGWGLLLLVGVVGVSVGRGIVLFRRRIRLEQVAASMEEIVARAEHDVVDKTARETSELVARVSSMFSDAINALIAEDRRGLREVLERVEDAVATNEMHGASLASHADHDDGDGRLSTLRVRLYDRTHDVLHPLHSTVKACHTYVSNHHSPPTERQIEHLEQLRDEIAAYLRHVSDALKPPVDGIDLQQAGEELQEMIWNLYGKQVKGLRAKRYRKKATQLIIRILLESKDIVLVSEQFTGLISWPEPIAAELEEEE